MCLGTTALIATLASSLAHGQTTGVQFLAQAVAKLPRSSRIHRLTLTGTPKWVAGSLHESENGFRKYETTNPPQPFQPLLAAHICSNHVRLRTVDV